MWWRSLLAVSILLAVIAAIILFRHERPYSTTPAALASRSDLITMSNTYAGSKPPASLPGPEVKTHEEFSAYDVSEGKRLYHWFNCVSCHANGGGDVGPPLMDNKWLYGGESRNIFASIVEGRPNGMPSFRGKIPDEQVWQLVAYVRSLGGQVPGYARSSRNDDIAAKPSEALKDKEPAGHSGQPSPDSRSNTP